MKDRTQNSELAKKKWKNAYAYSQNDFRNLAHDVT